jgi:hypothetical protein
MAEVVTHCGKPLWGKAALAVVQELNLLSIPCV